MKALVAATPLLVATVSGFVATRAAAVCVGDCDGSGDVAIDELLTGVNMALETAPLARCPSFDRNGDGTVTIDEIQAAVTAALNGCPPTPGGATGTPTPTPTRTRTRRPTATPSSTATVTQTPDPRPHIPVHDIYRTYPGYPIQIPIGATDAHGGAVHYTAGTLPNGSMLDLPTGVFSWTPAADQIGAFEATFSVNNEEVPPLVSQGSLPLKVQALDQCTVPTCDAASGCTTMLVPVAGAGEARCCTQEPSVRVPEPQADCPGARVVFVGRNQSGFGRLQNCDRLRVFNQGQVGATMRFNLQTHCLNIAQPVQARVQVVTKGRGPIVDRSQPVNLTLNADGYGERLLLVAPVIVTGPFFDFDNAEADVNVTLTDADGVTVRQQLRVVLTFDVLDDLPETP